MSTGRRCLQFDRLVAKRMRCNGHGSTGRGGDDLYVWRTFDRLIWFEKWVHEQSMQAEHTSALAELENAPPLIIQVGPTSASTVHYATFRWTGSANMQYVKCGMQPATCTQAMCNRQHTLHSRRDGTMQHAACSTTHNRQAHKNEIPLQCTACRSALRRRQCAQRVAFASHGNRATVTSRCCARVCKYAGQRARRSCLRRM